MIATPQTEDIQTDISAITSAILSEARQVLSAFDSYVHFESDLEADDDGLGRAISASGLVTLYLDKTKFTIMVKSSTQITATGSKFIEPLANVLRGYFPDWAECKSWVESFLQDASIRYRGLGSEARDISFRKSQVAIFVDVEAKGFVYPKRSANDRSKALSEEKT